MTRWLSLHSRFLIVAFLILTCAGGFALSQLPVSLFPTIQFPRLSVSLDAGDMPIEQMEAEITRPVEEALRAVPGVHSIRSQTSRGSAEISVNFGWGADIVTSALQSESELAKLTSTLPSGVVFEVRKMDPTIFPVMGFSITSEKLSQVALKRFAQYTLRPMLASLDGVVAVSILGGRDAEFEVKIDPAKLNAFGVSVDDVSAAISNTNSSQAAGRVEDKSRLYLVISDSRLQNLADIEEIVVKAAAGSITTLGDVADVNLTTAPDWTRVTADGSDAVLINIRQAPEANSLALTKSIKNVIADQMPSFPADVSVTPYYDQSDLIVSAASSVRDAIFIGTLLAGLILFLFLRSLRLVLIVAILLPAVLLSTSLLLMVLGQSLNIMTLGGMAAAVGLIVDDIVVMLEHISRRLTDKSASILEAAAEMKKPLIGSSFATIVVFAPLAFLSGVTGGFFKALALTMAGCLFFSMVYVLFVVPLITRSLLDENQALKEPKAGLLVTLGETYSRTMQRLLNHSRVSSLVLIIIAAGLGFLSSSRLASGFMPAMDEGGFVLDYVAPAGLSLTETDRLAKQVEEIIQSLPEVASYSRRTGTGLGGGLTEANEGDMFIRLKPLPRRPIEEVMAEVRSRVFETVPGMEIETIQLMGDLIGDLTAVPQPIEVKLYGNDPRSLAEASDQALEAISSINGIVEVQKSDRTAGDSLIIHFDPYRSALEGIDSATAINQLQVLVGGQVLSSVLQGEQSLGIRLWSPETLRQRVSFIEDLMLKSSDGHLFPVEQIANVEIVSGQQQSSRENLQPMTAVTGRLEGSDMGSAMKSVRSKMSSLTLPAGVRYAFGGLYVEQQKSFFDLLSVFAAALLLSGLLFVFLFRSIGRAIAILTVVGISISGVLTGLWLTGTELNIAAMMGLTMVIGIVAELGCFYFSELDEFEQHEAGTHHEHRLNAGLARMRPIIMSAVIAILALSPIALKIGQGSALLAPMAVAIISGLIVGAPLVLIATPLLDVVFSCRRGKSENGTSISC